MGSTNTEKMDIDPNKTIDTGNAFSVKVPMQFSQKVKDQSQNSYRSKSILD